MKPFVAATKNTGLSHVIFVNNGLCKYRLLLQKEFHSIAFGMIYSLLKLISFKMLNLHFLKLSCLQWIHTRSIDGVQLDEVGPAVYRHVGPV